MLGLDAHIDPLPVEAISYQNATGLNVGYDADDGTGYGKGSLDLSSAKGVRYEPRTGDTTVFYSRARSSSTARSARCSGPGSAAAAGRWRARTPS